MNRCPVCSAAVAASSRTIRIKDEQGDPIGVEQFLGIIQADTHRALRLMIERAASLDLKEPLFDWNTFILNRTSRVSTDETDAVKI